MLAKVACGELRLHAVCSALGPYLRMLAGCTAVNRCPPSQLVTLPRVPAAMEALVEALESDLLQLEWLLSALHESAHSGMRRLRHFEALPGIAMQDTQPDMAATHAPCHLHTNFLW